MNINLDDFMLEAQFSLDSLPYEDFSEYKDSHQSEGMVAALYFRWLLEKKLCHPKIYPKLADIVDQKKSSLSLFYDLAEGILQQSVMTTDANNFTKVYYRPGWRYLYYSDLESLFPDVANFSEIEDSPENIFIVFKLLDERFCEWKKLS